MKKKNKLLRPLLLILFSVIIGASGYWLGKSGMPVAASPIPSELKIVLLFFLIPAIFFVIAIHEAGHALAGIWVKFDFRLYVVGPFMWEKEADHWKFKWNKNINTAGGLVLCLPKGKDNLSKRFLFFVAGGPLASILLSAFAYAMYRVIDFYDYDHSYLLQLTAYCFILLALFSLAIFVTTAIPMQFGGFASDGARVLRLLRGGDTARFETLIVKIIADSSGGIRPKQYDLNELEEAQMLAKKINAPFGVYIHSYLHQAYFDLYDVDKAEQYLKQYIDEIESIPEGFRSSVWVDASFFYAFGKRDLDSALLYWNKYTPSAIIPKAQLYATEAVISFLRNEKENVITKSEAAIKELPNMMDKGAAIALQEKLERVLSLNTNNG